MEYISASQAAEKWHIHIRVVQGYCRNARIPGARKYGVSWMIPADADKPIDPRKARKLPGVACADYMFLTSADLLKCNPDATPLGTEDVPRSLAIADIAFRRGNPEPAKAVWREISCEDKMKLSAASLATAAAISSGDYALYDEIQLYIQTQLAKAKSESALALLSLPGTLAAVSMALSGMTPDWLKNRDFSLFPRQLYPFLLYLYALHLRNIGNYAEMLGIAEATLTLLAKPATFTWLDVYLSVLCAVAANALGNMEQTKKFLDAAAALGLPCGFISPFADHFGSFGGALESIIEQKYPALSRPISALWERSFKNWMRFHNAFTKDHITTVLSAKEYQIASLIACGESYIETARRMNVSVSRVKHILTEIYGKLSIHNKKGLARFIL